jgi:hypothetical protein
MAERQRDLTEEVVRVERELKKWEGVKQDERDERRKEERQVGKLEYRVKELE